jgi:ABC-2 type transport system permease protein
MMQMAGMAVAAYVVALLLRIHHDEAEGTLEPLLGTAVSRLRWLGAYAINAFVGALLLMMVFAVALGLTGGQVLGDTASLLPDLVGAALIQLPAIGVLGTAVVVVIMFLPQWSVGLSWAMFVSSVFVGPMFGPSLQLPAWIMDLSPFTHVPNAPAVAVSVAPLLGLGLACALLTATGVLRLRRRNLALPA